MFETITKDEEFLIFNKEAIIESLDPNKETIVAFTFHYRTYNKNANINGAMSVTCKTLEEKYNVIYVGYDYDLSVFPTTIFLKQGPYIRFKDKFLKRKKEYGGKGDEYNIKNHETIYNYIKGRLGWIKNVKYIVGIASDYNWYLLNQQYSIAGKYSNKWNEFHDYSGDDETIIKELKEINQKVVDNYIYYCNPLAFSRYNNAIFYELLKFFVDANKETIKSVDAIVFDPIIFSPILDSLPVNNRNFYFEDDHRGVRNLVKYPIAELQHLIYEPNYDKFVVRKDKAKQTIISNIDSLFDDTELKNEIPIEPHSKKFFFMGLILMNKGSRLELWDQYLKDLRLDNSDFYIPPIKNGLIQNASKSSEKRIKLKQQLMTPRMEEVLQEVLSHPLYNGYVYPIDVIKTIVNYRYTLILRCVSCCDSLNFRPLEYTYHKILPLLDPQYDPACLQIPKKIQEKLIVNNAKEIEDKIDYFEQHPEEREEILDQLWKHFEIDKWLQPNYYKDVILSYYP